ncbi:MAG: hypothetical protein R2778_05835 [Saprospiraceae bacterium]
MDGYQRPDSKCKPEALPQALLQKGYEWSWSSVRDPEDILQNK